jgi:hypothetical protein
MKSNTPKTSSISTDDKQHILLPATVIFPSASVVSILPIIESLAENTNVEHVSFQHRKWIRKELTELVSCLSAANNRIKTLSLVALGFEPNFIETVTKILKLNPWIKTLEIVDQMSTTLSKEGFNRFCDAMEYYSFEKLLVSHLPQQCYETLFSALKYNQSIKRLDISSQVIYGPPFNILCDTLVSNPTITELTIDGTLTEENYTAFKGVLKLNNITKLNLTHTALKQSPLKAISKALKRSTSITDLSLVHQPIDWEIFGKILSANKSIRRLDISENNFKAGQLELLNLGSNTTLTDLTLNHCVMDDYDALLIQLRDNKTLMRLEIGDSNTLQTAVLDRDLLLQYLVGNSSLVELKMLVNRSKRLKVNAINAITEALRVNKTLRELELDANAVPCKLFGNLMEALKSNKTLREFSIIPLKNNFLVYESNENRLSVEEHLEDLLKTNRTLRYICGAEEFPNLAERLKENRDWQDAVISNTRTWIKMIQMKPSSFVLPIELWVIVFKYMSYEYIPYDFEQFLNL